MPGPPPAPPWDSPTALALARARGVAVGDRAAWLALLRAALEVDGTQGGAARELGLTHRQVTRWLAWLRDHDAEALASLPPMPRGGYRRREKPDAPDV